MATRTTKAKDVDEHINGTPEVKTEVVQEIEQPLNLEQQVTVKNIAGWTTVFARMLTVGDVTIPKGGSIRLSRNEIISQIHNNNKLFCGIDNFGSHATLIIKDQPTLDEVGFSNADQFNDSVVKELFAIAKQDEFEKELMKRIVTRAEKYALMISIVKQKINDFSKIRFCENYTGYKIDKVENEENSR